MRTAINKEKTASAQRSADGQILGVGFWRNRGEVAYDSTSSVS